VGDLFIDFDEDADLEIFRLGEPHAVTLALLVEVCDCDAEVVADMLDEGEKERVLVSVTSAEEVTRGVPEREAVTVTDINAENEPTAVGEIGEVGEDDRDMSKEADAQELGDMVAVETVDEDPVRLGEKLMVAVADVKALVVGTTVEELDALVGAVIVIVGVKNTDTDVSALTELKAGETVWLWDVETQGEGENEFWEEIEGDEVVLIDKLAGRLCEAAPLTSAVRVLVVQGVIEADNRRDELACRDIDESPTVLLDAAELEMLGEESTVLVTFIVPEAIDEPVKPPESVNCSEEDTEAELVVDTELVGEMSDVAVATVETEAVAENVCRKVGVAKEEDDGVGEAPKVSDAVAELRGDTVLNDVNERVSEYADDIEPVEDCDRMRVAEAQGLVVRVAKTELLA
jgi:hypothetical protein